VAAAAKSQIYGFVGGPTSQFAAARKYRSEQKIHLELLQRGRWGKFTEAGFTVRAKEFVQVAKQPRRDMYAVAITAT